MSVEDQDAAELRTLIADYLAGTIELDDAATKFNALMDAIGAAQLRQMSGEGSTAYVVSFPLAPTGVAEEDPRITVLRERANVLRFGEERYRRMQEQMRKQREAWLQQRRKSQ